MEDPVVYLNGELTPLSEARIPVLDRGFLFGDGVYEVIPMYSRKLFRAEHHLARLMRSLESIAIPNPHTGEEWLALIREVSDAYPADTQLIYIQVTRGVAKRMHAFPPNATPTVFIMANTFVPPSSQQCEIGIACVTTDDKRWLRCDIKSVSLLGNVLAAQYAVDHGAIETIQFRDGALSEGSASNVWVVKDGKMSAPPKSPLILEGIRYGLIEELCLAGNVPFEARRIGRDALLAADEVMISSASKEILPVTTIDGNRVGEGRPGPVFRKLHAAYQNAKSA